MLIRSQNKEVLANMEGPIAIEILSDGKGHATMYWKDSYVLGTYSSKEKAIKVLDMIQEAYTNFESAKNHQHRISCCGIHRRYDTPENVADGIKVLEGYAEMIRESAVFQMPADSEVAA